MQLIRQIQWGFVLEGTVRYLTFIFAFLSKITGYFGLVGLGVIGGLLMAQGVQVLPILSVLLLITLVTASCLYVADLRPDDEGDELPESD